MLVAILGCEVAKLPSAYLGLPMGAPLKSVSFWLQLRKDFVEG